MRRHLEDIIVKPSDFVNPSQTIHSNPTADLSTEYFTVQPLVSHIGIPASPSLVLVLRDLVPEPLLLATVKPPPRSIRSRSLERPTQISRAGHHPNAEDTRQQALHHRHTTPLLSLLTCRAAQDSPPPHPSILALPLMHIVLCSGLAFPVMRWGNCKFLPKKH